jgi:hypothetical protein
MFADLLINQRLSKGREIQLVVPVKSIPGHIHIHILLKLHPIIHSKLKCQIDLLREVSINMNNKVVISFS